MSSGKEERCAESTGGCPYTVIPCRVWQVGVPPPKKIRTMCSWKKGTTGGSRTLEKGSYYADNEMRGPIKVSEEMRWCRCYEGQRDESWGCQGPSHTGLRIIHTKKLPRFSRNAKRLDFRFFLFLKTWQTGIFDTANSLFIIRGKVRVKENTYNWVYFFSPPPFQ